MSSDMGITNDDNHGKSGVAATTALAAQLDRTNLLDECGHTPPSQPPPPPDPSDDPHLLQQIQQDNNNNNNSRPEGQEGADGVSEADLDDIFKISATTAMEHLALGLEALVQRTGDVPATPPGREGGGQGQGEGEGDGGDDGEVTNMRAMQREKLSIVRSYSEKSLAKLRELAERDNNVGPMVPGGGEGTSVLGAQEGRKRKGGENEEDEEEEGITMKQHSKPKPTPSQQQLHQPKPYVVTSTTSSKPLNTQHAVLTRKFYSKAPAPVTIHEYLQRLHRYCPMSVGVYLATSLFIHRLAVEERAIAVTKRNVHRLVLGALRVTMKALEDHSYKHARLAGVGGVRPVELARLEVAFCFLTGFELAVTEEVLSGYWRRLRKGKGVVLGPRDDEGEDGFVGTLMRLERGGG